MATPSRAVSISGSGSGSGLVDGAAIRSTFECLDIDGDGFITKDDLLKGLDRLGLRSPDSSEGEDMLWEKLLYNDANKDGKISLEEFSSFALWRCEHLKKTFDELDMDGNGQLEYEEVQLALKKIGLDASKDSVKKIMNRMDADKDGKVSFEEFRQLTMMFPSTKINKIFDHAGNVFVVGYLLVPKSDRKSTASPTVVFASGGIAGFVSRTLTAPADRLKVMAQASTGPPKSLSETARGILKEGGVRAFWRGNGVNVMKIMPESACKFYAYEALKSRIIEDPDNVKVHERLLSGSLAGVLAQTIIYPMEVCKTRLAVSPEGQYRGLIHAARSIAKGEGARAFYGGLGASNLGIIPYAGVDLAV